MIADLVRSHSCIASTQSYCWGLHGFRQVSVDIRYIGQHRARNLGPRSADFSSIRL